MFYNFKYRECTYKVTVNFYFRVGSRKKLLFSTGTHLLLALVENYMVNMLIQTSNGLTPYKSCLSTVWKILPTSNSVIFISPWNFDWSLTRWMICASLGTWTPIILPRAAWLASHMCRNTQHVCEGVLGYNVASLLKAVIKRTFCSCDLQRAGPKPEGPQGLSELKPRNRCSFSPLNLW